MPTTPPERAYHREGTYWGIRSDIAKYQLPSALPCPSASTRKLADTPTPLQALDDVTQERLINWGYAVCDAAMRTHVDGRPAAPQAFAYAQVGVG